MDQWRAVTQSIEDCFVGFGAIKDKEPASEEAKLQAKALQDTITANYYPCSKEILSRLGMMYVADERFRSNIDRHFVGTAEFISRAIEIYCRD